MWPASRTIDRYNTTFDRDGLISNAGPIITATLVMRLGLEKLTTRWARTGAANAGRKTCTPIAAVLAGATHIDHVDVVRAGAIQTVLPFKVTVCQTLPCQAAMTTARSRRRDSSFHMRRMTRLARCRLWARRAPPSVNLV